MTDVAPAPIIGYLCSQYPAASHTFIRREIASLRRSGICIETFSVRRRASTDQMSAADREEYERTSFILPAAPLATVAAVASALARHPLRFGRTLALAMRHRPPGLRAAVWALFHFVEAVLLADRLREQRVSRLHCHFANSGATIGLLASRLAGVPWGLTLHGISETDYPAGLTLATKIANADFVACASWFMRAQAMRLADPADWPKLTLVRCGLDLADLPVVHRHGGHTPRIVCVGRLSPEKGQAGLIDALAALLQQGVSAELVLVGDGPDRAHLGSRVAESSLEAHVRFAGQLDERAAMVAIAESDVLVLPSFMEGLPVVLMEAMAIGVPVVASHVAGVPELVEDGVTGRLFHPGDWSGLATAIAATLTMPADRRDAEVQAAREAVARRHAIDAAVAPLRAQFAGKAENSA